MIKMMSKQLNFDIKAEPVPAAVVAEAHEASRAIHDPNEAKAIYQRLAPSLTAYRADQTFSVACGLLMEKQRLANGMLDFWTDLRSVFPEDQTALRMMMRWFRRERRTDAGIAKLHSLFPRSHIDLSDAEFAALGFSELRAFDEIDRIMAAILPAYPDARAIRMRYIKTLNQQSRYLDAQQVADSISDADKMGASSRALIDTANRRAAKMSQLYTNEAADVFASIIRSLPIVDLVDRSALGAITFYTGQLGTGGAERQMTRIASAFQDRFQKGTKAGGIALTAPCDVAVRHTTPESGADFYVPVLRRARVATTSLADVDEVPLDLLHDVPADIINLLELLPEDVFDATCKLIPYFQDRRTQVAYLWQDGGVLFAALAALIAGVPRIVTSFRGLPPNMRPNLYRPELPILYRAMACLPQVKFSANSQIAATAYEDWLGLQAGEIAVLPNAMLPVLPDGSEVDTQDWHDIVQRSSGCFRTVVGVFRFDENKRPLLWIESAAAYISDHPDTRFVMVGTGYQFATCIARIKELGLEDRIFLTGVRENVGFYLHKADLVMHLARMEGLPNVLIEAHLAGVPVLATPAGGTAEVVEHGITGQVLNDADDPQISDIVGCLKTMLTNKDQLTQMGQDAKSLTEPRFLIDTIVDRTASLFSGKGTSIS